MNECWHLKVLRIEDHGFIRFVSFPCSNVASSKLGHSHIARSFILTNSERKSQAAQTLQAPATISYTRARVEAVWPAFCFSFLPFPSVKGFSTVRDNARQHLVPLNRDQESVLQEDSGEKVLATSGEIRTRLPTPSANA